jgi:hypothetical protein
MLGSVESYLSITGSATGTLYLEYEAPNLMSDVQNMVKEAQAAHIQVVFGLEPQAAAPGMMTPFNAIMVAIAAANNIPVINYGDALCQCVTALDGGPVNTNQFPPLLVANQVNGLAVTTAGYALMTQMAEETFATIGASLRGGYLQNFQYVYEPALEEIHSAPVGNVNTTPTGTRVQFTPVGLYSNGAYEPITNTNLNGASGTWVSSNPLVMYVNPQGLAYALSGGTTNITYTSPTGVKFAEWTMYVTAPAGADQGQCCG